MRYLFFVFLLFATNRAFSQIARGTNGVTYRTAVEYNDYIVDRQTRIGEIMFEFSDAIGKNDLDSADRTITKSSLIIDKAVKEVRGMPVYNGDSLMRNSAIQLFNFYQKAFNIEYKQAVIILRKGTNITEEDIKKLDELVAKVTKEEKEFDALFQEAQQKFAQKNKLNLTENKLQKKINNND